MLGKVLIFVMLGACSSSVFGDWRNEVKKLSPVRNVQRFAINVPGMRDDVRSKMTPFRGETAGRVLEKLQSSLLIQDAPLGSFRTGQMLQHFGLEQSAQSGHELKLGAYNIANCTSPPPEKAKLIIRSLSISPDPAKIPGTLTFTFDIDVLVDIPSAEVNVDMEFRKGSATVKIPCLGGQIGSCDYKNICDLLSGVQSCPPEFNTAKIPCKCPFNKGSYKLPGISVEIDAEVFLSGDYTVKAQMTSGADFLGCYIVNFTISD